MRARFVIVPVVAILVSALAASAGFFGDRVKSLLFPPTRVLATVEFADDGSTLKVAGRAWGLTPGEVYVSLIYDVGSSIPGA